MTSTKASFPAPRGPGFNFIAGGSWEKRELPSGISDGDESKWPRQPSYRVSDERNYLTKLAQNWAQRDGSARPGVNYYLDKLPTGYGCFEIDQPGGPQTYKRLFGHPSGRFYDSIAKYETHFFWLLDGKQGKCQCFLCGNYKPTAPPKPKSKHQTLPTGRFTPAVPSARSSLPQHRTRPSSSLTLLSGADRPSRSNSDGLSMDRGTRRTARQASTTYPIDEEGTRNIWKDLISRTHVNHDSRYGVEDDIKEEDSIDWLSERETIPQYLTQIEQQHCFVPRIGETVLWIPNFTADSYLLREPSTGQYQFYDFGEQKFIGLPTWRAGVVTAVPSAASKNGAIDFPDILDFPEKKTALNTSGFRVETMPDPNDDVNKSASKQYKYVPLRSIRPLSHWQLVLKGIAQSKLHSSILNALTCMTSISLVEKYKYNADWHNGGYISMKGVHLGSELITLGDTIRLLPQPPYNTCTEVLVVESIRLRLSGFKPEHTQNDTPTICSSHYVTFLGQAYTTNIHEAYNYPTEEQLFSGSQVTLPEEVCLESVKSIFRPVGTAEYGSWWPLHNAESKFEVSYEQVLGRLYEADAIRLWSGQRQHKYKPDEARATMKPDLGFDLAGILAGRVYATKTDERIAEPGEEEQKPVRWLISDNRAQALSIASINGLETTAYHEIRTPATLAAWRAHIKISNGERVTTDVNAGTGGGRPRPKYVFGDEFSSQLTGDDSGRRRGRPAGSKVIDGKLYRAGELAGMNHASASASLRLTNGNVDVDDLGDEVEDEEIDDAQPIFKHSSQMAGAAVDSTDEEDLLDEEIEDDDADDEDQHNDDAASMTRPLQSRLAAYGGMTIDSDVDIDDPDDDAAEALELEAWQLDGDGPSKLRAKAPVIAPSKSQIMESVEHGHGSTLENVQNYDYDSDEDEWTDDKINEWKDIRNARGGSQETDGGDYTPDS